MSEESTDKDVTAKAAGPAWWRLAATPTRRRRLLGAGAVVVAVLLFVVVPGLVASQPSFLSRYPEYKMPHATWATSKHRFEACQGCHVRPGVVAQTAYGLQMAGAFYLSFLAPSWQPAPFAPPSNAACLQCHNDKRTVSPSGDLNIPHRAHVEILNVRCVVCHKYLVHELSPEGKHTPAMGTCLTCHNGVRAKNNCSACHRNKSLPPSHRAADWLVVHPEVAKTGKIDCASCHKWTGGDWCVVCHRTRPRSHTATWRADHGKRVATHRDCEVCHTSAFCIRCHGTLPMLNYDPKVKLVR